FQWSEYEQLMISEALHRGESVFNIALHVDPNSVMRAAAFQLIRNVLHGCGTVIALRPEDNAAAATVEVVEAAIASHHPQQHIEQRCKIPSIVSELRVERSSVADTVEHEMLGDLLDAQAANSASTADHEDGNLMAKTAGASSAVAAVAESTL